MVMMRRAARRTIRFNAAVGVAVGLGAMVLAFVHDDLRYLALGVVTALAMAGLFRLVGRTDIMEDWEDGIREWERLRDEQ